MMVKELILLALLIKKWESDRLSMKGMINLLKSASFMSLRMYYTVLKVK